MRTRGWITGIGGLLVGYLLTGVHQVLPGERAIVRRFGRVLAEKPEPGVWIGLPWGIDRVDRVGVNLVRRIEVGYFPEAEGSTTPGQFLTGDHNLVNVRVAVDYAVAPGDGSLVEYALYRERVDRLVGRTAEAVLAEWIAGRGIDDILIRGKAELPAALLGETRERLRNDGCGVELENASVVHLLPPEEVKPAFDDVTRAQADISAREERARQLAARRLGDARMQGYAKVQQANAEARDLALQARAEADVFEKRLEQYRRLRRDNPDILTALWWEQMTRLLSSMKEDGRVDLLDNHLGGDGLDITVLPPLPKKK